MTLLCLLSVRHTPLPITTPMSCAARAREVGRFGGFGVTMYISSAGNTTARRFVLRLRVLLSAATLSRVHDDNDISPRLGLPLSPSVDRRGAAPQLARWMADGISLLLSG